MIYISINTLSKQKMKGDLMMGKTMEKINIDKEYNTTINLDQVDLQTSVDKTPGYFISYNGSRQEFIQGVERLILTSNEYKKFHSFVVSPKLELKHGPIFDLKEIIGVVIDYFLLKGKEISMMTIKDEILEDHYEGRVQIMLVSKKTKKIANSCQVLGDIQSFMYKYNSAISNEKKKKYEDYIQHAQTFMSSD